MWIKVGKTISEKIDEMYNSIKRNKIELQIGIIQPSAETVAQILQKAWTATMRRL